jgi:Transposase DDE domain group 1
VALACEITAWMQMLALHGHPGRRWEPKRLRLLSAARLTAASSRATTLHLSGQSPWTALTLQALQRLKTCTATPAPSG